MIVVTGAAGFIGSVLVWYLNRRGRDDILAVDHLRHSEKWKNLVGLRYDGYVDKEMFIRDLEAGVYDGKIEAIVHLGACSSTVETDGDYLMENNYRYSVRIASWREMHPGVRLVYASSAATYGGGERGYCDDEAGLQALRPLNLYALSKHLFDLHALRSGWLTSIAGLKYFNVFGPNENHKAGMRSVVNKAFPSVRDHGRMQLFKSYRPEFGDGEQRRDFIYVKDAVEMTLFFLDNPGVAGIHNVGTGVARTWNDCARALFQAVNCSGSIEYISMPEDIRGKYQYVTEADLGKLRRAGCTHECRTLENSIRDYVVNYLMPGTTVSGGLS